MENSFSLLAKDNYLINGVVTTSGEQATKAIVIAHGIPCTVHEDLYKKAAEHMAANGYDVIRFGFYDEADKDARHLASNATLETMQQDLNFIVSHFSREYKDVFVMGHSYGGLISIMANPPEARAICLLDPTLCPDTAFSEEDTVFDTDINAYRYSSFVDAVINPELVHQANALNENDLNTAAAKVHTPVKIIYADDGTFRSQETEFFAAFKGPKYKIVLDKSDHFFSTGNAAERALDASLNWIRAHEMPRPSPSLIGQPKPHDDRLA